MISSFADGPVYFDPTGPAEDQTQKLISSTGFVGNCPPKPRPHFFMFAYWGRMRERSIEFPIWILNLHV